MNKAMTILYSVKNNLYVNLTNKCPCACSFCIRSHGDHVYEEKDSLWLQHEPSFEEVKAAFATQDMTQYDEVVFCGYGEPTCALDLLVQTASFVKDEYHMKVRLNTNGLGDLINNKPIAFYLAGIIDTVSISLNTSDPKIYEDTVHPQFKDKAWPAIINFTKSCKAYVPNIIMTTVDTTITHDDEEKCRALCNSLGVTYRIREYSSSTN